MELNDIIELVAKRDSISYNEAVACVEECQEELKELVSSSNCTLDDLEDCIAFHLSLEPDYLEILLEP